MKDTLTRKMEIMENLGSHDSSHEPEWAISAKMFKEDESDDWKNRRAIPLTETASFLRSLDSGGILNTQREEDHIRIFASLVPDEVIYHIHDYTKRNFEACLLFGDVSGFTDLCEKYNKTGKGGPSKLTQVLNNYIGAMVQEILSHDGDVFKFSGDAFIALWKVTENLSMKDAVHEAIDCSLVIQKNYGRYQADQDVVIRVKLAISAGSLSFSLLGDMESLESAYYFVFGSPILDLKSAEALSSAGDIIITKTAWQHVSPNEYLAEDLRDGKHTKIYGVGPNWRNIQRTAQYGKDEKLSIVQASSQDERFSQMSLEDEMDEPAHSSSQDMLRSSIDTTAGEEADTNNDRYALRPSVNLCLRQRMLNDLKKFIITPVERGVMADEPIEYLTEIRQVTVLFINCKINISSEITSAQVIDTSNEAFIKVSKIVKENYGCLNKLNMFDKDLLMLVIFGLRGLKHEMESQTALKCATECYESLTGIANIAGVAAAVTTGKTYCGAFGHALRREYTVISLIVNKAARLMVAYPNRVTCDRETFLHSKLEARNFLLQEYKPLKGIINPGPIYEFKEVEITREALTLSSRPLLGREQEMDLYGHLYKVASECRRYAGVRGDDDEFFGMLIIQGESRQGKTRLLEELIYSTDPDTPLCRFTLAKDDAKKSFGTIRLLFNPLLGLNENSSMSKREAVILKLLRNNNVNKEAHCLNHIFDLNLKTPPGYDDMDRGPKYRHLKHVFTNLCQATFSVFWVIAIDNAEFIDDESWVLINILTKLKLLFIVATMNLRSMLTRVALEVLKMPKIKIIQMKCIDKWFHVGLVCQILEVEAIPPELEKVIQSRSNGNPGWVESFLISLEQSGGLFIKTITRKVAYETGLVIPPLYMMERLSEEEQKLWIEIMEEGESQMTDPYSNWKMYVDACWESHPNLAAVKSLGEKFDLATPIKVCVLNPSFNIDEVDPELAMDVIILKTFDSLTSYEQLLIKCSAILGDIFPRDMLMYIMSSSAVRLTALAVKKLFEIHVLSCARGNFLGGGLVFNERFKNPNEITEVTCECQGLIIDDICQDLPKYSSCGYMRFLSTTFRETTYNLLTDNQKREFHARAIRYLEKETRKCRACGNGYFTKHMGNRLDYDLKNLKRKKTKKLDKKTLRLSEQTSGVTGASILQESDTFRFSIYSQESGHSNIGSRLFRDSGGYSYPSTTVTSHVGDLNISGSNKSFDSEIEDMEFQMIDSRIGFRTINKYKDDYNITKTFSDADYSQCTCLLILNTMYTQMIEHCSGAGLVEKLMNAMIDFCYVCIESQNVIQTLKILEEALDLLEGPLQHTLELDWMVTFKRGKLFAIMGYARLQLEQYQEGYKHLVDALDCYGIKFPTNVLSLQMSKMCLSFQQDLSLFLFPRMFIGRSNDDDMSNYCNDVAECLGYLYEYYMAKKQYHHAKLAALWALREAKWSETDFSRICSAYANIISISTYFGDQKHSVALEVFSFELCQRKKTVVEREELMAIAKMYCAIFFARAARAEVEKSIHIGYLLWRIGSSTHMTELLLSFLPLLVMLILMRKHINVAGNIMQEISMTAAEDTDISGKCWYYALCVSFHLETGLIIIPIRECITFTQGEGKEHAVRDPDSKKRLIVAIWLWYIRTENWEGAYLWEEDVMNFDLRSEGETIQNLLTALYVLEGLIVNMVRKMDDKNIQMAESFETKIEFFLKKMLKAAESNKIILPRIYHFKAYYHVCMTNKYNETFKRMKKAVALASNMGNDMEISWLIHNEQALCNKLSKQDKNFWRVHAEEDNHIEYNEADEFTENFKHFTLPVPNNL